MVDLLTCLSQIQGNSDFSFLSIETQVSHKYATYIRLSRQSKRIKTLLGSSLSLIYDSK